MEHTRTPLPTQPGRLERQDDEYKRCGTGNNEAFEPAARRLTEKVELHHTPKHGSWLNFAEIELSILARQRLDQRIGSLRRLRTLTAAWLAHRKRSPIRWRTSKRSGVVFCSVLRRCSLLDRASASIRLNRCTGKQRR